MSKFVSAFFLLLIVALRVLYLDGAHHDGCRSVLRSCDPFDVLGYSPDVVVGALVLAGIACLCIASVLYDRRA